MHGDPEESTGLTMNGESAEARILPGMSVREISTGYPACREVLARHGMGGGDRGPDEPLEFFAHAHHVDLVNLTAELEGAARREHVPDTATPLRAFEQRLRSVLLRDERGKIRI